MKIILADSHGTVVGKEQTSPNLSLLYLASYVRANVDIEVDFNYIPQSKPLIYHIDLIRSFCPEIYAVSFTSFTAIETYKTIRQVKQLFPNVMIVSGGPHVTFVPEEVLKISGSDICVIGEGCPSDTWNSFNFLNGVSKKEFKTLYASARMQQAIMAFLSGNFEWRNYKGITEKHYI